MKRNFIDKLLKWAESPRRKPLVLSGARQVGNTNEDGLVDVLLYALATMMMREKVEVRG